ncbi:putative transcriptional regulator [Thermoanaerobacter sp. YS13]|uniref:helix-turn-helix transcriptional regulator n=1 Tax=Thermoanaerobacter sp. YS13 TaxID=1511746 RepID=UPI00057394F1|nr:helix-turn-helix transcriptional regulator [Thermoanaerobacter sp. YS13]KHO63277.1 putative transcriptional regulator [Thermoanaerobacter sp. YS13]
MRRKKLKELRKKYDLSVKDIANTVGISTSHYYKIEEGIRNPTLKIAKKIAEILGENVDEVFFEKELDVSSHETKIDKN